MGRLAAMMKAALHRNWCFRTSWGKQGDKGGRRIEVEFCRNGSGRLEIARFFLKLGKRHADLDAFGVEEADEIWSSKTMGKCKGQADNDK